MDERNTIHHGILAGRPISCSGLLHSDDDDIHIDRLVTSVDGGGSQDCPSWHSSREAFVQQWNST